jgi:hypothetical protein
MKLIFTLFSILLLTITSLVAQTKRTQKPGLNPKHKSTYSPKKGTAPNQGSQDANKPDLNAVAEEAATEKSAKNNITGIWKGYFVSNSFGFSEDRYRFEVQLAQLPNDALNGVTYSYKTTVFYGKAEAKGINTTKTNNIILNELKLVDLKITEKSEPCLMTCYLEYNKMGEFETLTGTYSSRNANDKGDCGVGKVYLEKKPTSDFYKEEFVTKRENELKKKTKPLPGKNSASIRPPLAKNTAPLKHAIKPGAEQNLITAPERKTIPAAPEIVVAPKQEQPAETVKPPVIKIIPKPEILKSRENEIVKTITTHAKEFKIDLYDNGEIDGDRISVYHNNQLIVSNKTLTDKPISFTIKTDEHTLVHEFVMVAENLGTIPPNTALMIVTAGSQRYEIFVTSTEQKNAIVRIVYQPQ